MDFSRSVTGLGQEMVQQITQEIYKQIVWESIIYSMKVGIIAGLIMAAVGTVIGVLKLSSLDLTTYTGCMLTGKNKGSAPFIAGFLFHMLASAVFGVVYLYLIYTFKIPGTLQYAVALGVANSFFSGCCMLLFDRINPCTRNKMVPYVGFMATAQGMSSVLTYAFLHIVFATVVLMLLTR